MLDLIGGESQSGGSRIVLASGKTDNDKHKFEWEVRPTHREGLIVKTLRGSSRIPKGPKG